MLPKNHEAYLDPRPCCQVCHDTIHADVAECPSCGKLVCEDCHVEAQFSCQVCSTKLEQDKDFDVLYTCRDCMKRCKACGLVYHKVCKLQHQATCNPWDRARRDVSLANKQVRQAKLNFDKAKKELHDAKVTRLNAEKSLRLLQRSPAVAEEKNTRSRR